MLPDQKIDTLILQGMRAVRLAHPEARGQTLADALFRKGVQGQLIAFPLQEKCERIEALKFNE